MSSRLYFRLRILACWLTIGTPMAMCKDMKCFDWNDEKNKKLKEERGVSFEDVILAIEQGRVFATFEHPNKKKYAAQQIYIVEIADYAFMVPFLEDENGIFLKTIIPSRKMTKLYIKR